MNRRRSTVAFIAMFGLACARAGESESRAADSIRTDSIARARQDSVNRAQPGYVVDSLLPIEEELRRFRAAIGGSPVTALAHGSASREELVRRLSLIHI